MFRSILCATDFSPGAADALELAVKWAEARSATLDIVHVVPPLITRAVAASELLEELHASIRNDAEGKLEGIVAALKPRLRARGHVRVGFGAHEILAARKELESDVVVLGMGGEGPLARAFLGSVADRVLRGSDVPVLLVPTGTKAALPRVVLAPTDLSEASVHSVREALDLAEMVSATVEVVHAYKLPIPLQGTTERDHARTLREGVRGVHALGARANLHVVEGPPARSIIEVASSTHADLIVMAGSGRGVVSTLLGGVADRVIRTCHVPALVLREKRQH